MVHFACGLRGFDHVAFFVIARIGRRFFRRRFVRGAAFRFWLGRQRHPVAKLRRAREFVVALLRHLGCLGDARAPPRLTLRLLVVARLAFGRVGVPFGFALRRPRRIEPGGLWVRAYHAIDLNIALEFLPQHVHNDGIIRRRIDAFCQRTCGMPQRQRIIAEPEHAGFGKHDFSDLIPLADTPPQLHPFPLHCLHEVTVIAACRCPLRLLLRLFCMGLLLSLRLC